MAAPAHPRRRTLRTALAVTVALCAMLPGVADAAGVGATLPWLGGVLAVASGVTRVLALPGVETFLRQWAPWLAASDVAAETVVAQVAPDGGVVAGGAHPLPDGTPLPGLASEWEAGDVAP